ncbi:DEAD-domain-containing protein [Acaromyces ingoldii]|uniref:ATP-dependent RNA helicase n=1 Tax=Acaromyces ingoldii TaxID=215250 RepID=A0A316YL59_9BASI|nr:DEAD-domain-containing protein [Acaromyces ingoldii]PWN89942.1 DEAD-domain-containing protein [Acaromyces ingoldii]
MSGLFLPWVTRNARSRSVARALSMFSVKRFDGSAAASGSNDGAGDGAPARNVDRIAAINRQMPAPAPKRVQPVAGKVKSSTSKKQQATSKTKAKERYLKAKKERRKARQKAMPAANKRKKVDASQEDEVQELAQAAVEEGNKGQGKGEEVTSSSSTSSSSSSSSPSSSSSSSSSSSGSSSDSDSDSDSDAEGSSAEEVESQRPVESENKMDVDEPEGLSRLPAPRQTEWGSKADLALQGLPQGLTRPTLVDPELRSSVKANTEEGKGDLDLVSAPMRSRLEKLGVSEWFAVQTSVIPMLLSHPTAYSLYPSPPPSDLCVSAPTGSGKTLAYAVPIVEVLRRRICIRLRALIVLPTRDLVNQVRETMQGVCKGSGLSIASVTGQQSFAQEQALLVNLAEGQQRRKNIAGLVSSSATISEEPSAHTEGENTSKVDILIATPGRLIDHLDATPGFTLQHLRFLVIDEADRLLGQSFQEWLPRILDALDPRKTMQASKDDASAPAWLRRSISKTTGVRLGTFGEEEDRDPSSSPVQKLLFSATLTRDPAKILALDLRDARFVSVQQGASSGSFVSREESFALPSTLHEHYLVVPSSDKPLHLFALLRPAPGADREALRSVLCFTKSVESASRLVKLVELFEEERAAIRRRNLEEKEAALNVQVYSSELGPGQRMRMLDEFRNGQVDVLVCSDVISRGIDLPHVRHVVSYDVAVDMAKHVHRIGRTARAGKRGDAWTLVEEHEAWYFKRMQRRGSASADERLDKVKMDKAQLETAVYRVL